MYRDSIPGPFHWVEQLMHWPLVLSQRSRLVALKSSQYFDDCVPDVGLHKPGKRCFLLIHAKSSVVSLQLPHFLSSLSSA